MTDKALFHQNERAQLDDLTFVSDSLVEEHQRQNRSFLGDNGGQVSNGFYFSIISGTDLRITRGAGFFGEGGDNGQLVAQGTASRLLTFTGLASGTYFVWVRARFADGEQKNRTFWDATGAVEVIQLVNTRQVLDWDAVVAATQPSADYDAILDVDWDASNLNTSTITDLRNLLFDARGSIYTGATLATKPVAQQGWGNGANDRSDDRAQYPIGDFETFAQMVLQKIQEIQTGDNTPDYPSERWWDAVPDSLDNKLSLDGNIAAKPLANLAMDDFGAVSWDDGAGSSITLSLSIINIDDVDVTFKGATTDILFDDDLNSVTFEVDPVISKSGPQLDLVDTGGGAGGFHAYTSGAESVRFGNVLYQNLGVMDYDCGPDGSGGAGAGGAHAFSRNAVNAFVIDIGVAPVLLSASGISVEGNDLYDDNGGAELGLSGKPWTDGFFTDLTVFTRLTADGVVPEVGGALRSVGEQSDPWDFVHTEVVQLQGDTNQVPGGQPELTGINQQRVVLARVHKTGAGTPAITGDHFNVLSITGSSGVYAVNLDQAVDTDSSIEVTWDAISPYTAIVIGATFLSSTQIQVRTKNTSDAAVEGDFWLTVVGRPATLQ